MKMWWKPIRVSPLTQRSSRQWPTFPKLTTGLMWICRNLIHPQVSNPRLAGPGMISTWSVPTPLNQVPPLWLWWGRTKCWMEQTPGLLELACRVPMKTRNKQKTTNLSGPYSLESTFFIPEDRLFPSSVGLEAEDLGYRSYSILGGYAFGVDTFRASWTGPLSFSFNCRLFAYPA